MSIHSYQKKLSTLVENSLLHLYMTVAENSRFASDKHRNDILVKFLKAQLKGRHHKGIKGDIKLLIRSGRSKNIALERKLFELNVIAQDYVKKHNDIHKLFELLEILESEHNFKTQFLSESEKTKSEIIYVLQEHIEHCFDEAGMQVAPVSLQLESKRCDSLVNIITASDMFIPEVKELNEKNWQLHILLHPSEEGVRQGC